MKRAILLAAYGATGARNHKNLQAFEQTVRNAFPGDSIRWAFTSVLMRSRLAAERKKTDSVKKALCRLGFEKFTHVTVQSLHIIPGREYQNMLEEIAAAEDCGAPPRITIGLPLLSDEEDVAEAAHALVDSLPPERKKEDAAVWAGHGSWHSGDHAYRALAGRVRELDANILLGNLSGGQSVEQVLRELHKQGAKTVWLLPLLSVIGKHAAEDLAGSGNDSWRNMLKSDHFNCIPVVRGVIEYKGFMDIWLKHLKLAAD